MGGNVTLQKAAWEAAFDGLKVKREGLKRQLHFYNVLKTLAERVIRADPETVSGDIQLDFGHFMDTQDDKWKVKRSGAVVCSARIIYFDPDVCEAWPEEPDAEDAEEGEGQDEQQED